MDVSNYLIMPVSCWGGGEENLWRSQSDWLLNLWSVWYLCPCILVFITAYVCETFPTRPLYFGK